MLGVGQRHMAERVRGQRLRGPPPPPGPGCQSLLPGAGRHQLPSQGEGAESWGGARNPGKDPRSFPERKSPLPPRGRKPGGQKGKCSLRAPGGCGGQCLAHCPSGRAPPTARQGPSNLGAFHAWVPAQETAQNPGPGPRWPGASLAPAAGGAQPVPVTHFGASAARGARRPQGGAKAEAGPRKVGSWRCETAALTSLRPSTRHLWSHQHAQLSSRKRRLRPRGLPKLRQPRREQAGGRRGAWASKRVRWLRSPFLVSGTAFLWVLVVRSPQGI